MPHSIGEMMTQKTNNELLALNSERALAIERGAMYTATSRIVTLSNTDKTIMHFEVGDKTMSALRLSVETRSESLLYTIVRDGTPAGTPTAFNDLNLNDSYWLDNGESDPLKNVDVSHTDGVTGGTIIYSTVLLSADPGGPSDFFISRDVDGPVILSPNHTYSFSLEKVSSDGTGATEFAVAYIDRD